MRAYREAMASFAQMGTMDIWYAYLDEDELMASIRTAVAGEVKQAKAKKQDRRAGKQEKAAKQEAKLAKTAQKRAVKTAEKAHARDSLQALSKLGELVEAPTGSSASRRSSSRSRLGHHLRAARR